MESLNGMNFILVFWPLFIFIIVKGAEFFSIKFWIFIKELKNSRGIKLYSSMLYIIIVVYFVVLTNYYEIIFFRNTEDMITFVLGIWSAYGLYVGFLQFMAGYDNKENGTYLGYQKMDFLTQGNVWYYLANGWMFFGSLLLSIMIPLILYKDQNSEIPYINLKYQFLWQGIISFLLILFIFLLKFSFEVAQTTIYINKKDDEWLKNRIEYSVKSRYTKHFKSLLKDKFNPLNREKYFKQIKKEMDEINNKKDKIAFLRIVFELVSIAIPENERNKFKIQDINNYQLFIKERYDFIKQIQDKNEELINLSFSLFKSDTSVLDALFKINKKWLGGKYKFEDLSKTTKVKKIPIVYKIRRVDYDFSFQEVSSVDNIHFYMFKIIAGLLEDTQKIESLIELIKKVIRVQGDGDYWQSNKETSFKLRSTDTELRLTKKSISQLDKIEVVLKNNKNINKKDFKKGAILYLNSDILEVNFIQNEIKLKINRNEVKDYYDRFVEKAWTTIFEKYFQCDNLSTLVLPKLKEPETYYEYYRRDKKQRIRDWDNKIPYSEKCIKFLIDRFGYINSENPAYKVILSLAGTMTKEYQGAFALYQLLPIYNYEWDSSIEVFGKILSEVLNKNTDKKEEAYKELVLILNNVNSMNSLNYMEIFQTKLMSDISGIKMALNVDLLRILFVQDILNGGRLYTKDLRLNEEEKRRILINYLRACSITPNLLSIIKHDRSINMYLSRFLTDNLDVLKKYDYTTLPLPSLLYFEKWKKSSDFMINLCNEGQWKGEYDIYDSLLQFITLKLIEEKEDVYSKFINSSTFKRNLQTSLLRYFKIKDLTVDTYINSIADELENYPSFKLGTFEKEMIKKAVEGIVYEKYSNL